MQGYILRVGKQRAKAILLSWLNGHTAVFMLCDDIGCFRKDNNIKVNMNTMEASLYISLIRDAA